MHCSLNISTIYRIGGARTTWRILRFLVKHRLKTQRTHMQSTHLHANFIRHSYDGFNTEELSPQQLFRNLHKSWWNRLHSSKIELQNIFKGIIRCKYFNEGPKNTKSCSRLVSDGLCEINIYFFLQANMMKYKWLQQRRLSRCLSCHITDIKTAILSVLKLSSVYIWIERMPLI